MDERVVGAGIATAAVAGVLATGSAPAGFWPVTVVGWLTMATSVSALIVSGYLLYKKSLSPVVVSVEAVKKHFDEKIMQLEGKHDREMKDLNDRHDRDMRTLTQEMRNSVTILTIRIEQNETDIETFNRLMAESREDRRHINEQLVDIRRGNDRIMDFLLNRGGLKA
jgi:hypothetical protein